MKIGPVLAVGLLISVLASRDAHADCQLQINPSSYIPRGQFFSFGVDIQDFGPLPSYGWTIVFFGTKNGVADIPPTGEQYPGTFRVGYHDLTGFQNPPTGGLSGNYTRYVVLYTPNGQVFCVSNTISATLE
jgi:hypothetical protein